MARTAIGLFLLTAPAPAQSQDVQAPETAPAPTAEFAPTVPQNRPVLTDNAVSVLGSTEGDAVGLLDATDDLGEDLWSNTPRGMVTDLLQHGLLTSPDPAMRTLAKRIVLTKADAPAGASERALITVRISQLLDAGLIDEAGTLASRSKLANNADFARVQANALLYAGRSDAVCTDQTASRLFSDETFWIELRAYCAAAAGDDVLTELTQAALQAQGDDAAFEKLLDDIVHQKDAAPEAFPRPTALHFFMLRKLGLPIPAALADQGGTPEKLAVATDNRQTVEVRMRAAERLIRIGAGDMTTWRALADIWTPAMSQISDAENQAPDMPLFSALTLLRRAAQIETHAGQKEKLVVQALTMADEAGMQPFAAAYLDDILLTMTPGTPDADREKIARALLLAGEDRRAADWMAPDDALRAAALLMAADRTAENDLQGILQRYADEVRIQQSPDSYKSLIVGLAADQGRLIAPPPNAAEIRTVDQAIRQAYGKRPDDATMAQVASAAAATGRKGEALLLILDQVRTIGWRDMAPEVAIAFVHTLRALGLGPTADAFAKEALLLYSPPAAASKPSSGTPPPPDSATPQPPATLPVP